MSLRISPIALAVAAMMLLSTGCDRADDAGAPAASEVPRARAPGTPPPPPEVEPAPRTPALKVATLDGAPYDLAAHRGKWVVVNFWATWCAPCLKEMPELSTLDADNDHIEVIGLAYEEIDVADMRAFLADHPVRYPVAIVDVTAPPEDFETPRGLPMTYLIAPDGRIAQKFLGPVTARELEEAIAKAGGPAVAA